MALRKSVIRSIDVAKKMIVEVGRQCWSKGWVAGSGGNISYRIGKNEILCTPTGVSKGMLTEELLCLVDGDGNPLRKSPRPPSSELKMHLRIYKERPDLLGVVHAHPPYATAHAIAGIPLSEPVIPEMVVLVGPVPLVPYGTPSTDEVPDNLAPFLKNHCAWLLENHGALAAGIDPLEAFFRMEMVEQFAKTIYIAKGLGKVKKLDKAKVKKLQSLRNKS
jgi:L-fuculose-phosphate aldolase